MVHADCCVVTDISYRIHVHIDTYDRRAFAGFGSNRVDADLPHVPKVQTLSTGGFVALKQASTTLTDARTSSVRGLDILRHIKRRVQVSIVCIVCPSIVVLTLQC